MDRRRSSKGLFELRARREGIAGDRRQGDRRTEPLRSWRKLLQRFKR